jgi:hypothetical protein
MPAKSIASATMSIVAYELKLKEKIIQRYIKLYLAKLVHKTVETIPYYSG